jgi:glycosyltransferase involved in cell wall biosynthesis
VAELRAAVTFHGLGERVRFVDMVPRFELAGVYGEHDVLVFPSTWQEPFGLTQVEAMACGLPVIGTGTGGSAEILTEETALRYPPGDASALAECLALLAADPDRRRRMGAAAQERVARHFDLDQTALQTEVYLRDVVATWTPGPRAQWKIPFAADNPSGFE